MTQHRAHPTVAVLVDVLLAVVVLAFGAWSVRVGESGTVRMLVVVIGAALAAAAARRWAAAALVGIWVVALVQVCADGPVVATTLGVAFVAFRCARYGSRATGWLAGLSIPLGAIVAVVLAYQRPYSVREVAALVDAFTGYGVGVLGGFLVLAAVLAAPFAAGLLLRVNERYRRSRIAREVAESQAAAEHEIAQSRAAQTMLTRDVHDVVGHSLAVIIAQADSAQAVAATADESVRAALEQISAVGRSSLAEIRDVLTRTGGAVSIEPVRLDELADLVAGVRNAGNPVHETVSGDPQPLGADAATAAYRVLQELLTNALKHRVPGSPIEVARVWTADGLSLRVANPATDRQPAADGMGLSGVRSRLAAVDGTLRTAITGDSQFVAVAFLPASR